MSETKATEKVTNPWKIMKKFRADKDPNHKSLFVGVNGRMYQVPCGKEVEVPLPIYERLVLQREAIEAATGVREEIEEITRKHAQ